MSSLSHPLRIGTAVLSLDEVSFVRDGRTILSPLTWKVLPGQRWLVLGANGSGKTTLLRIAAMYEHPSRGDVDVLGEQLGRTDVRVLRRRDRLPVAIARRAAPPELRCLDVVMTAKYAALEPWWHRYDAADAAQAARLPRPHGRRLACRARARHRFVGRAATRAAGAHADERAGACSCSTSRARASTSAAASSSSRRWPS